MPKPFQRPSIDLGGPKKEWLEVPASMVRWGDIVVDHGRVVAIQTESGIFQSVIRLKFLSGEVKTLDWDEKVMAFGSFAGR
jgi:hypothetical protein